MFVDSHCHLDRLDLTPYPGGFPQLMAAPREAGGGHIPCAALALDK